jgi:hypothetical protein
VCPQGAGCGVDPPAAFKPGPGLQDLAWSGGRAGNCGAGRGAQKFVRRGSKGRARACKVTKKEELGGHRSPPALFAADGERNGGLRLTQNLSRDLSRVWKIRAKLARTGPGLRHLRNYCPFVLKGVARIWTGQTAPKKDAPCLCFCQPPKVFLVLLDRYGEGRQSAVGQAHLLSRPSVAPLG